MVQFKVSRAEVLDAAVERINEYDSKKDRYKSCGMCDKVGRPMTTIGHPIKDCALCPFYSKDDSHSNGLGCGDGSQVRNNYMTNRTTVLLWQKELIERTKVWCEKFYPKYTIENKR